MVAPVPSVPPLDVAAVARRVIEAEAAALLRLSGELPADFRAAVEAIRAAPGRVVVSGIGKSGHIGRKIAATLASTGTPAMFLHPSEASHGDLGMVGRGDVCLLISNSGETAELRDLLSYAKRFGLTVIGVCQRPGSTLLREADLALLLPNAPEACAIGMAPTTSTTMALALGDALAVALMEDRGFRPDDFRLYHPGGTLGARLLRAGQLMRRGDALPTVAPDTPMDQTILTMTGAGFGVAAVVDAEGRLFGVVTDGDLRRNMAGLMDRTAGEVATRDPVTIGPDVMAAEALGLLNARKIGALIVADDAGRPLGILRIHDLLQAGVA